MTGWIHISFWAVDDLQEHPIYFCREKHTILIWLKITWINAADPPLKALILCTGTISLTSFTFLFNSNSHYSFQSFFICSVFATLILCYKISLSISHIYSPCISCMDDVTSNASRRVLKVQLAAHKYVQIPKHSGLKKQKYKLAPSVTLFLQNFYGILECCELILVC